MKERKACIDNLPEGTKVDNLPEGTEVMHIVFTSIRYNFSFSCILNM